MVVATVDCGVVTPRGVAAVNEAMDDFRLLRVHDGVVADYLVVSDVPLLL